MHVCAVVHECECVRVPMRVNVLACYEIHVHLDTLFLPPRYASVRGGVCAHVRVS